MTVTHRIGGTTKKLGTTGALLMLMLLASLLTGFLPQKILTVFVAMLCVILMFRDELYLAFPFIFFYNELYGLIFGMSVSRFVSFMLMALFCIKLVRRITVDIKYLAPITVYVLYALLVIPQYSMNRAIVSIVDIACCVFIVCEYLNKDEKNLRKFAAVYIMVALVAAGTGLWQGNIYLHGGVMPRFLATFDDPNIMGFFYTVAAFFLVSLKLFRPWLRCVLLVLLYGIIFASLSMTALLLNIILWVVYLAATRSINMKTAIWCLVAITVAIVAYQYGLSHPDTAVLGDLSARVEKVISNVLVGDLNNATTGRGSLAQEHWQYFIHQPFWRILFGGTAVNIHYISYPFDAGAHNEYIDMLLNVGLIGTCVMVGFTVGRLVNSFKQYRQTGQEHHLCRFMVKCVWMLYCFSLPVNIFHPPEQYFSLFLRLKPVPLFRSPYL